MSSPKNKISSIRKILTDEPIATFLLLLLILRVLTWLWVALVSSLRPITEIEKSVSLWPPTSPTMVWLERTLIAPWQRWDTQWYIKIIDEGYHLNDGTAQFHPLYPWFATPLARLGLHPVLSLLLINFIFSLFLMLAFEHLARCDLSSEASQSGTILFITSPIAAILFLPYSEVLFLTWAVLCLLWARQRHWWLAGVAGALATMTRQQGIFLTIPLAWELWEASGYAIRQSLKNWRNALTLIIIPAGYIVWLFYRAIVLSDLSANFTSFNSFFYSLLISPSASKVVTVQQFTWPWLGISKAFNKLSTAPDLDIIVDLLLATWLIIILGLAWPRMRTSYKLYSLAIIWISFSYYTGPIHPYMGLPRHLLLAFPMFIGLGAIISRPRARMLVTILGIFGLLFLLFLYVLKAWVP